MRQSLVGVSAIRDVVAVAPECEVLAFADLEQSCMASSILVGSKPSKGTLTEQIDALVRIADFNDKGIAALVGNSLELEVLHLPCDDLQKLCRRIHLLSDGRECSVRMPTFFTVLPDTGAPLWEDVLAVSSVMTHVFRLAAVLVHARNQWVHGDAVAMSCVVDGKLAPSVLLLLGLWEEARQSLDGALEQAGKVVSITSTWDREEVEKWQRASHAVMIGLGVKAFGNVIVDIAAICTQIHDVLPSTDQFLTDHAFHPSVAKRILSQKDRRSKIANLDALVDAGLQGLGEDWATLHDSDPVVTFPDLQSCRDTCTAIHKLTLITAMVSLLHDKATADTKKELEFVLTLSEGVQQPLVTAIEEAIARCDGASLRQAKSARRKS